MADKVISGGAMPISFSPEPEENEGLGLSDVVPNADDPISRGMVENHYIKNLIKATDPQRMNEKRVIDEFRTTYGGRYPTREEFMHLLDLNKVPVLQVEHPKDTVNLRSTLDTPKNKFLGK